MAGVDDKILDICWHTMDNDITKGLFKIKPVPDSSTEAEAVDNFSNVSELLSTSNSNIEGRFGIVLARSWFNAR